jgi:hypothetical protein
MIIAINSTQEITSNTVPAIHRNPINPVQFQLYAPPFYHQKINLHVGDFPSFRDIDSSLLEEVRNLFLNMESVLDASTSTV